MPHPIVATVIIAGCIAACTVQPAAEQPVKSVDFDRDVKPIFTKNCNSCHGAEKQRGGLRLDGRSNALSGGESGKVIVPGKPAESKLYKLITSHDPETRMPPRTALSDAEIATLRLWIEQGADGPDELVKTNPADWWSFKPIKKPLIPAGANPIDHFVREELSRKGLTPSKEADRRTLIRRLYFDLIGLPPPPETMDAFVASKDPDAYEKLVDTLLASEHHGERWARHWLDVVHFGETHGYDKDKPRLNAWPYRDYVIRSFNQDKPYRRFIEEQIAGDVLFPATVDGLEALGFLSAGPWDFIGHAELPESKIDGKIARHLDRDDFVSNTISTFMGLTAHCAQCHNHKFDPITQEDYYRLQAVFAAIDRTEIRYITNQHATGKIDQFRREHLNSLSITAPALGHILFHALRATAPQRTLYAGAVHTGSGTFVGTGSSGGKPRPIHILARGDVTRPGKEVSPGSITTIPGINGNFKLPAAHSEGDRRAALAKWITDKNNPLTWRVMANRIWQYHFGRGLVDTPNDFGKMGQLPTHPELLDFLAAELREHQSLKRLHKLIVMSAVYRQSSIGDDANAKLDSDNLYLWRQNRRKLEAEAVRDSILFAAGKLNLKMGGPGFQDFVIEKPEHSPHYQYHLHDPEDQASHRRSIYRFVVRSKQQPFMAALDCADPSLAVEKRNETQTPQQALALLNNRLAVAMAKHFAERVEKLGRTDGERITAAVRLALGRDPTAAERDALTGYAKLHGLANTCRVILNLNEFVFVD